MKLRHVLYFVVAIVAAWALMSCDLGGVSISQRISDFQDDLNTASRSNAYKNFHPDKCGDYDALKDPSFVINTIFPTGNRPYSLDITDDSDSSAVIVHVTGSSAFEIFLRLDMQTTGSNDYRIVSMDTSPDGNDPWDVGVID